jgi:hypothetical protein
MDTRVMLFFIVSLLEVSKTCTPNNAETGRRLTPLFHLSFREGDEGFEKLTL